MRRIQLRSQPHCRVSRPRPIFVFYVLHLRAGEAVLEAVEFISILCTTLFTGAAIYVNLAEHPARMVCGTELAATEWAPSYKRAARMQAPLAMIGTLTAFVSWRLTENILWFVGTPHLCRDSFYSDRHKAHEQSAPRPSARSCISGDSHASREVG